VTAEKRWLWNDTHGWYGYARSRRAAADMAALAFAKLPPDRRATLLDSAKVARSIKEPKAEKAKKPRKRPARKPKRKGRK
jgi:hypothetical protein